MDAQDKISLQNNAGSHRNAALEQYDRSPHDLYTTPAEAVRRLYMARPQLKHTLVWDSSAGLGHIVRAALEAGGPAVGTELHDHPWPKVANIRTGVDLFSFTRETVPAYTCIVNPPYNGADRHIRHMLALGCEVYALLRFNWICARKRAFLLPHLREIMLIGRTHMPPPGAVDQGQSPSIDYAWFRFTPEKKADDDHGIRLERA